MVEMKRSGKNPHTIQTEQTPYLRHLKPFRKRKGYFFFTASAKSISEDTPSTVLQIFWCARLVSRFDEAKLKKSQSLQPIHLMMPKNAADTMIGMIIGTADSSTIKIP